MFRGKVQCKSKKIAFLHEMPEGPGRNEKNGRNFLSNDFFTLFKAPGP